MIVSVVGAGKMGLPLACLIAENGADVRACDANPVVVDALNRGECTIDEPGVAELLARNVEAGRLRATTDTAGAASESDVVIVIVPALLTDDHHAELGILESVTHQIAPRVRPGTLVVYETTVPVGTTRNVFAPILSGSGALVGYSPERVKSGLVLDRLTQTPKVCGGEIPEAAERVSSFYEKYLGAPVINVDSLEAAEFVKLAGMLYRDVNIALANQLANYAELIDVDFGAIAEIANSNGEAHILQPGVGVGGHCTPVYPYFLIHDSTDRGMPITLASEARTVNDAQSEHVVQRVEAAVGDLAGTSIVILGLGFRPGVKEHLYSPAFLLREALVGRGANVTLHDSLYTADEIRSHGFEPGEIGGAHILVLNTAHDEYVHLDFEALQRDGLRAVADGRNIWSADQVDAAGVTYIGVGRG